jgi:DNA-binding PadR family transcriptional regulator
MATPLVDRELKKGSAEAGQRRCGYRLTRAGKKILAAQRHRWQEFVEAIGRVTGIEYA